MLAPLVACAVLLGASHPNSQSSSRIVVEGRRVEIELVCQTRSLVECVPIDGDGDFVLDPGELERGRAAALRYLGERYRISEPGSAPLAPDSASIEALPRGALDEQRLRARFVSTAPAELAELEVRVRLFLEENPFHRDTATLSWNGEAPATWLFGEGVDTWRFEPAAKRRPGVLGGYLRLGVEHILTGYDHLAFLIALIVASRRIRSLAGVVTAFTAAHSITLGLAALGWVTVPGRLVEIAIALSIAYVGAENLLFRRPATRWVEAFLFGLIHGLGFASVLEESLLFEPLKFTALVGFNLGVEAGQLAIVLAVALALRWLPGDRRLEAEARAWFAPRWLRLAASLAVTTLGAFWFVQRSGWIG
jgi:hydrogenase/urease accessory protein HupE